MQLSDIQPNIYPVRLLMDCDSGLCLFGAGFYGANDAIHMFHTSMPYVQVVDNDADKIAVMEDMYPPEWVFTVADITTWVPNVANTQVLSWDIVSVDAQQSMFPWVLSNFDTIAKLANKYIVLTMSSQLGEEVAYHTNNREWKMIACMSRSLSGLIELLVYERVPCQVAA